MLMSGRWRQVEVLLVSNRKIQQSTDDNRTTWYPTLQHLKSVKRLQEIKSCSCTQLNLILCPYLVLISGDEWALRKDPNVTNETAFPQRKDEVFEKWMQTDQASSDGLRRRKVSDEWYHQEINDVRSGWGLESRRNQQIKQQMNTEILQWVIKGNWCLQWKLSCLRDESAGSIFRSHPGAMGRSTTQKQVQT